MSINNPEQTQQTPNIKPQKRQEEEGIVIPQLAEVDTDYPESTTYAKPDLGIPEYKGDVPGFEPVVDGPVEYTDDHKTVEYNGPGEVPTLEPPFNPEVGITGAMRAKMQHFTQPRDKNIL
jgi:hypothetical protein